MYILSFSIGIPTVILNMDDSVVASSLLCFGMEISCISISSLEPQNPTFVSPKLLFKPILQMKLSFQNSKSIIINSRCFISLLYICFQLLNKFTLVGILFASPPGYFSSAFVEDLMDIFTRKARTFFIPHLINKMSQVRKQSPTAIIFFKKSFSCISLLQY